MLTNVGKTQI